MATESARRIHRIYGIMQSICLIMAGICLIAACFGIYSSGGDPVFSREKVADAFSSIALWIYLCLAVTVGGFLLNFFCPLESKPPKTEKASVSLPKDQKKLLRAIRIGAVVIAIGLLIYGFLTGGTADVETKAKNICTECIGLG